MSSIEQVRVYTVDFVITYSQSRLKHMTQYDESNCKSIFKIIKRMVTDKGGKITNITSSSINSKSIGGTHLVLETTFTNTVDPKELESYFNQQKIAGVEKITVAI